MNQIMNRVPEHRDILAMSVAGMMAGDYMNRTLDLLKVVSRLFSAKNKMKNLPAVGGSLALNLLNIMRRAPKDIDLVVREKGDLVDLIALGLKFPDNEREEPPSESDKEVEHYCASLEGQGVCVFIRPDLSIQGSILGIPIQSASQIMEAKERYARRCVPKHVGDLKLIRLCESGCKKDDHSYVDLF